MTGIGVIGAGGWLGGAIVRRMLGSGMATPADLILSYRTSKPDDLPDSCWTRDNQELADRSDVILISVRPEDWQSVDVDARGKLVISVMAAIGLEQLSRRHSTERVIRALPNAAADVGMSYTPWVASADATAADRDTVRSIFGVCGLEDDVADEPMLDYLSGLTGTGPAYPALLAQALIGDAVARGLDRRLARRAVATLLIGAGRLLERSDEDPSQTVETFLAYRGVTAAGIAAMRAAGFEEAIRSGLEAAFARSAAMSTGNR